MLSSRNSGSRGPNGLTVGLWITGLRTFSVLAIAAFCTPELAQSQTTGRIAGSVKDQTGAVLVGAEVRVVSNASGDERKVTTDEVGAYGVALLPPGLYRVNIAASGFQEVLFENTPVAITETT